MNNDSGFPAKTYFKNDVALRAVFGIDAFNKLVRLLTSCCGIPNIGCCPSQKYTLSAIAGDCVFGNIQYSLTVVSNITFSTNVFFTIAVTIDGTTNISISNPNIILSGVVEGTSYSIGNAPVTPNKTATIQIFDSAGNYSQVLTVNSPSCS